MKKLIVSLLSTLLLTTGLVAGHGATTAATAGPYTGTVDTVVDVERKRIVKQHRRNRYVITVSAGARGTVRVLTARRDGGFRAATTRAVNGETVVVRSPRLHKRGSYRVRVRFFPAEGSVWQPSQRTKHFRVVR
jgi:hypothetical protein